MENKETSKEFTKPRVAVVGRGNVGSHLVNALQPKAYVELIDSRRVSEIKDEFDFIIIAVSDKAINEVAEALPQTEAIVVHTSGSIPMGVLRPFHRKIGVFYPLQTFTKGKEMDYSVIPFFIEGLDESVTEKIKQLALKISSSVYIADSLHRKQLHLASVFACNFVNHLYNIAWQIMSDAKLPNEVLIPLIKETAEKVTSIEPGRGQTGPAVRKDMPVINNHITMLEKDPYKAKVYKLLTEGIMKFKE